MAAQESVTVWLGRSDGDGRRHARLLLHRAVAELTGLPTSHIILAAEPGGRPQLVVPDSTAAVGTARQRPVLPQVAISHARGLVAVALSWLGPVGVDVEPVRELPVLDLARIWFTEAETEWLATIPRTRQAQAFLLLWTQKEAVGKALGVGLRGGGTKRAMPAPDTSLDATGSAGTLRTVPGVADVAVAGWLASADVVVAVACQAAGAMSASIRVHHESAGFAA